jgi:hypothetical protein
MLATWALVMPVSRWRVENLPVCCGSTREHPLDANNRRYPANLSLRKDNAMDLVSAILSWFGHGFFFATGVFVAVAIFGPNRKVDDNKKTIELMEERNAIDRQKTFALEEIAVSLSRHNKPPVS